MLVGNLKVGLYLFMLLALGLVGTCTLVLMNTGYGWAEMDWNEDGTTSVGELLDSTEIGKREIILDHKQCAEYFHYKDASPVRTVCP